MKRTIELSDEFIDDIFTAKLKEDYERTDNEIQRLKAIGELQPYQQEDLKNSKKIRKASKRMLTYHGVTV